jgi:hypothetical protein
VSDTWIRGTRNQRLKEANPRGIRALKPLTKVKPRLPLHDYAELGPRTNGDISPPSTEFRLARGSLKGGLNPGKSLTRMTRGRARRPLLIHLLIDKAFNATTSAYMATTPPMWEQYQCLILAFTAYPGMDGKRLPSYPGFSGVWPYSFLINPLSYVPTRPRAPPVNKGTTPARRLQEIARPPQDPGLFTVPSSTSPRHHRDGRPSPGHVATATSTSPIVPSPPRHHPKGFLPLGLHLSL